MTVDEPANCTVEDENGTAGQIVTKHLTIHGDWMDTNAANQKAFVQFRLGGPGCGSLARTKNITGSLFGESANNTGVDAASQNLIFSPAVQATAGAELKAGTSRVDLTASLFYALAGEEPFTIKP